MSIRYVGPHASVSVPLPEGGEAVVANGDALSSSPEHERSLLAQDSNWRRAREGKKD